MPKISQAQNLQLKANTKGRGVPPFNVRNKNKIANDLNNNSTTYPFISIPVMTSDDPYQFTSPIF